MIVLGIAGKPNVGKSTFFMASTLAPAEIAPYPFTTISPNIGIAHVRVRCACCDIREGSSDHCGSCIDGNRFIPVQLIDVAGLVKGAHEGRGLGNEFLDDLRRAEVIIHVVDASGSTDADGNPVGAGEHDPVEDIISFEKEFKLWILNILKRNWRKIERKASLENTDIEPLIAEQLAGVGVSEVDVKVAISRAGISDKQAENWRDDEIESLAHHILHVSKRMIIAANKADIAPDENIERIRSFVSGELARDTDIAVIPCSAEAELALRRASERGIVRYLPGDEDFEIIGELTEEQRKALMKIREFMHKNGGTGVQKIINYAVLNILHYIVVYPVEDEHKFSDSSGRILPDAFLMKKGSTARDLAFAVHTDIGKGFLFAVDARTKRRLGERYELKDGDIIKIVHSSRSS